MTDTDTFSGKGISVITELSVGEAWEPDPNRPSLILRRVGEDTLWDIAKSAGSTVEAIMAANRLAETPPPEAMVLIPIA
ncbi:MAG: LysM peptidoglycan-binding domain-containing protein [Clostridia bacterium]|nr:LysM peptidoglycan-binding domain-containing protein [Clostridia bacterium]